MQPHRAHGEFPILEQVSLIPPELTRAELVEATARMLAATQVEGVQVGPDGGRGVVAPDQFVVHALQ